MFTVLEPAFAIMCICLPLIHRFLEPIGRLTSRLPLLGELSLKNLITIKDTGNTAPSGSGTLESAERRKGDARVNNSTRSSRSKQPEMHSNDDVEVDAHNDSLEVMTLTSISTRRSIHVV